MNLSNLADFQEEPQEPVNNASLGPNISYMTPVSLAKTKDFVVDDKSDKPAMKVTFKNRPIGSGMTLASLVGTVPDDLPKPTHVKIGNGPVTLDLTPNEAEKLLPYKRELTSDTEDRIYIVKDFVAEIAEPDVPYVRKFESNPHARALDPNIPSRTQEKKKARTKYKKSKVKASPLLTKLIGGVK